MVQRIDRRCARRLVGPVVLGRSSQCCTSRTAIQHRCVVRCGATAAPKSEPRAPLLQAALHRQAPPMLRQLAPPQGTTGLCLLTRRVVDPSCLLQQTVASEASAQACPATLQWR